MIEYELLLAIVVMSIANFITRVFPFLFFISKEPPKIIVFVEKNFPPIIMTILIFYTLVKIDFLLFPYGLKELISIIIIVLLHIRFNNYLVSIFLGTLFYMVLMQFVL
jgi:branched-subunit amino acid transport protein AzlD